MPALRHDVDQPAGRELSKVPAGGRCADTSRLRQFARRMRLSVEEDRQHGGSGWFSDQSGHRGDVDLGELHPASVPPARFGVARSFLLLPWRS